MQRCPHLSMVVHTGRLANFRLPQHSPGKRNGMEFPSLQNQAIKSQLQESQLSSALLH